MAQSPEIFELSLLGGATERRYLALRGELDLPWGSLDPRSVPEETRELARHTWTEVALSEFASAAVHSELIARLVRARAPLDLIGMATRFPLDELVHAEIAARLAEALGGGGEVAYVPERIYPKDRGVGSTQDLAARIVDVCLLESCSLGILRDHARRAREPLLRAAWARIAKDEAIHARFGWLCLAWLAPALTAVDHEFLAASAGHTVAAMTANWAALGARSTDWFNSVGALGTEGPAAYLALATRVLKKGALEPLAKAGIRPSVDTPAGKRPS